MHTCSLSRDEKKFFMKNPHCIASLCGLDRLDLDSENQGKLDHVFKYMKETPEEISEAGFKRNLTLKDLKRERKIYETIDQLIPDAIKNMGSLEDVKYHRNAQRPTTSAHIGQLKLFLSTMQFLLKYSIPGRPNHVVYPGSAPGNNIDLLTRLFPDTYWYLYDPRDVFYPELYQNKNIKKIVVDFFLDSHIEELQSTIPSDEKMLFISDIRVCTDVTEETVDRDMKLQSNWVKTLRPDFSMLKFRLPRHLGERYTYLEGELFLQMFAPGSSTETRLVVDSARGFNEIDFDVELYEGLMYFFNRRARLLSYNQNLGFKMMDGCHDCVSCYTLIEDYLEKYSRRDLGKSDVFMKKILDHVGGKKLEKINGDLRRGLR